jgi:hypothetical protein
VSLLKKAVGHYQEEDELPELDGEGGELIEPEEVLATRSVQVQGEKVNQVLIKWKGQMLDEATWEDVIAMRSQFPSFCLEDKAVLSGGSIDRSLVQEERSREALAHHHTTVGPKVWYVYSRRKKDIAKAHDS